MSDKRHFCLLGYTFDLATFLAEKQIIEFDWLKF